jgi:hypothetical protein
MINLKTKEVKMKALVKIAIILSLGTVLMARVMKDYK